MKMIWSVQNHFGSIEGQGTIQVLCQQRGGWGQKMAIFADLQYYLCRRRWVFDDVFHLNTNFTIL